MRSLNGKDDKLIEKIKKTKAKYLAITEYKRKEQGSKLLSFFTREYRRTQELKQVFAFGYIRMRRKTSWIGLL